MYGSRAVTLLVLISDDVINRILKLDIQTNILVYVTRCCTDLTSKVLKERTFGQSSALLVKNVLYVIKCGSCGEEYIGQTGDFLRKRVTVHNQQIRDPKTRMLYVSGNIDICAHQLIPKYMTFHVHKVSRRLPVADSNRQPATSCQLPIQF